jgi:hypothetical protein
MPLIGIPLPQARGGKFDFGGVAPGVYLLQAMPGQRRASPGDALTTNEVGWQTITVGNADVDDVVLQVRPGAEITGKSSLDGEALAQRGPAVRLSPIAGPGGSMDLPRPPEDGTFAIHDIMPSVYQVNVLNVPPGTYVKSIRFGDQDLMKTTLDLTSGGGGAMSIELSKKVGDVSGFVRGADGTLAARVAVSLWVPGALAEGSTDFVRSTLTDTYGKFQFTNLPPGEYRLAAWEGAATSAPIYAAPELRIKFEGRAATVKVEENGHSSVEVPMIDRAALEAEAAKLHLSAAARF